MNLDANNLNYTKPHDLLQSPGKFEIIKGLINILENNHSLVPIVGAELEFYIIHEPASEHIIAHNIAQQLHIEIEDEKGNNQYEIKFAHRKDIISLVKEIELCKQSLIKCAKSLNSDITFAPKPFKNDYGSSLQIHINFENHSKINSDINIDKICNILCNYIDSDIEFFIPNQLDLERLDHNFMAPENVSWGYNNRSCMLRLPPKGQRRIEHRLAGANINPILPIYSILRSIILGLSQEKILTNFPQIYGNSWESQYNMPRIRNFFRLD